METRLLMQLRTLVGRTLTYDGHTCQVIEVLEQDSALVLRCMDGERVIQGNQFGEATRRVRRCHTLPLFDKHRNLNPVIRAWLD